MAEYRWLDHHPGFGCPLCGVPSLDAGFIDLIGDTQIFDAQHNIVGVVDIVICARCISQAAKAAGCAMPSEVEEMAQQVVRRDEQIADLEAELLAWQQRFADTLGLASKEFDKLSEVARSQSVDTSVVDPAVGPNGAAEEPKP